MTNNTKTEKSELGGKKVTDYWEIVVKTSIMTQEIYVHRGRNMYIIIFQGYV